MGCQKRSKEAGGVEVVVVKGEEKEEKCEMKVCGVR